ncbi:MAG: FtsH protease activity modulator HflK [Planctomycetota bacterium]|nr:FtsH protease activity modulator HflK [Planctomycetota bacterium]
MQKQSRPEFEISPERLIGLVVFGLAAIFVINVLVSGMYSVAAHEQAVVLRFGKYVRTVGPGLHFKAPWIDQRFIVDQGERTLRLPHAQEDSTYHSQNRPTDMDEQEDKLILTGDLYAAVVEWNVFWRVVEPKDYLINFNGDDGEVANVIVAVSRSVMHRAVGDYSAEELLTGKREEITKIALEQLSAKLADFGSGIAITDLQMQRVTPPDKVKPAFDDVNASIQQRDQSVNEAYRERNQLVPTAEAQRDRLIREAEGYASRELAEAQGEISALLSKYESYKLAPDVTRNRMYIEMMEKVLTQSGPKIILDGKSSSPLPLLNLSPNSPFPASTASPPLR